ARIGGDILAAGAQIQSSFSLARANIAGNVEANEVTSAPDADAAMRLMLAHARIGGRMQFRRLAHERHSKAASVDAEGLKVGGECGFVMARLTSLGLKSASIGGLLNLGGVTAEDIALENAHIDGPLHLLQTSGAIGLNAANVKVGADAFVQNLTLKPGATFR